MAVTDNEGGSRVRLHYQAIATQKPWLKFTIDGTTLHLGTNALSVGDPASQPQP